ncbi:hypothetical protein EG834_16960, partial [bacterium]|nr:hypothetical protein [bacterium]
MFARLAINLPAVSGMFDYAIPPALEGQVEPGSLVTAPFRNQMTQGVVMELLEVPAVAAVKPIESLLDPVPVLSVAQMELAKWMSDHYLQPLAAVIGMMLPAGLSQQADVQYTLTNAQFTISGDQPAPVQKRLIDLLKERGT